MQLNLGLLLPWSQARARANARAASSALSQARAEREEIYLVVARDLAKRHEALSA